MARITKMQPTSRPSSPHGQRSRPRFAPLTPRIAIHGDPPHEIFTPMKIRKQMNRSVRFEHGAFYTLGVFYLPTDTLPWRRMSSEEAPT